MVLSQLKAGVETRAGALLTGARGSGKTTSARVAFDELAPGFDRAAWITGTAADSRVPFGAFERLFTVPETGRTIQVLRAAREALGTGLLLVVDDGHLLDRLSASLVYQLAVSGAARVIVTAESNHSLPEGLSSLVRDRLVVPVTADEPVRAVVPHDSAPPPPDGDGVVGRLRRAVRALDGGALPVAELAAAADDALRLGDLELAERLGRAALPAGGLATRITLSYALAWQGRGVDADAVLAEVDASALTEPALMMWALPRAANQFWMLSEPERATAFLRTVRSRVQTPAAQVTLDALSATFAMNAGNLGKAVELADEPGGQRGGLVPAGGQQAGAPGGGLRAVSDRGHRRIGGRSQVVADEWTKDCRIVNIYGPAEATLSVTMREPGASEVLTQGLRVRPRARALRATRPAAIST